MNYPDLAKSSSELALIDEFYRELLIRYPELKAEVEHNEDLLHVNMSVLQNYAEKLCKERRLGDLRECFKWVNSLFCRSKSQLRNAIYASFLEYFEYEEGLSEEEFIKLMPKELYGGYAEMMECME